MPVDVFTAREHKKEEERRRSKAKTAKSYDIKTILLGCDAK